MSKTIKMSPEQGRILAAITEEFKQITQQFESRIGSVLHIIAAGEGVVGGTLKGLDIDGLEFTLSSEEDEA